MKIKLLSLLFYIFPVVAGAQIKLAYKVDIQSPEKQYYHVTLNLSGLKEDSLILKLPNWMPGYYQNMNYFRNVDEFSITGTSTSIKVSQPDSNTWKFTNIKSGVFTATYRVKSSRKFVASTFLDSTHGYIIPGSMFFYVKDKLGLPVTITINTGNPQWKTISGLNTFGGKPNQYTTNDFDILYDSPILIGPLEELSSFVSGGAEHRFIGYKMGEFDRRLFMANLKKMVDAAIAIIGDTPFRQYTFIAIGPGRGGIEHLNNTTVSFTGNGLNTKDGMNGMMNFLAHEYFHHYNVKRIRPYELGPFDYDRGSKTNLLWVSEGLSVYYEYLIVKRAGLTDESGLLHDFEGNINSVENNPGRLHQTLVE